MQGVFSLWNMVVLLADGVARSYLQVSHMILTLYKDGEANLDER